MSAEPVTIGIQEAAALLRMNSHTLMRKTRKGEIPGAKFGRRWVYVREDLIALVRARAGELAARASTVVSSVTSRPRGSTGAVDAVLRLAERRLRQRGGRLTS